MSMLSEFNKKCGAPPFNFQSKTIRKIGLGYLFKFGKYKGCLLVEVLSTDEGRAYVKNLYEKGDISFTKKDGDHIRRILNV